MELKQEFLIQILLNILHHKNQLITTFSPATKTGEKGKEGGNRKMNDKIVMKKHVWDKLISIAKEAGIKYTKRDKPDNTPTYFWTKGASTFCGHMFNLDEWKFYELCRNKNLI